MITEKSSLQGIKMNSFIGKFTRADGETWQFIEFPATERLETWADGQDVFVEHYNQALMGPPQ